MVNLYPHGTLPPNSDVSENRLTRLAQTFIVANMINRLTGHRLA